MSESPNHADHGKWTRHSPCVYCACGVRLYNGTLPKTEKDKRELGDFLAGVAGYTLAQVEGGRE